MRQNHKTIDFEHKTYFNIPAKWRRELQIEDGITVTFRTENNSIIITPSYEHTLDVMSTVGRKGLIYVPKEIRNYFERKRLKEFLIYIEEVEKAIIMKPLNS